MAVKQNNRLLLLDSLRGLAALIVVFHHIFIFHQPWFLETFGKGSIAYSISTFISDRNHDAVLFFFVLSGFVIHLSTRKLDFGKRADVNHYLYKRFRRILPLYWITILLTLFLGFLHGHPFTEDSYGVKTLLGNLLFIQTSDGVPQYWIEPYGENGPLWSLAYEMFFYLFFPLYWRFIHRFFSDKRDLWLLAVSFVLGLLGIGLRQLWFTPYFSFLALFPIWMAGYFLGSLYLQKKSDDRTILLLSLVCLGFWLFTRWMPSDTLFTIVKSWFFIIVPGYLFFRFRARIQPATAWAQRRMNGLLAPVGDGSYAIYLLHYPLLLLFQAIPDLPFEIRMLILAVWCFFAARLEVVVNRRPFEVFKRKYV